MGKRKYKKILIFGGTGFLGNSLIKLLLKMNAEIILFTRIINSGKSIQKYKSNPNIKIVHWNFTDLELIKENILKLMPDLIITHSEHDYHADHRSLSILTSSAVSHYIPILCCDTLMGVNFQPNYYFNITEHIERKKEAVLKHYSQKPDRFVDLFQLMNSYRAAQCNAPKGQCAEAYSFTSSFPFSDIGGMLPASIKLRPFQIEDHHGFL